MTFLVFSFFVSKSDVQNDDLHNNDLHNILCYTKKNQQHIIKKKVPHNSKVNVM